MKADATPKTYDRKDMLTVGQICKKIPGVSGGPCSRQHVYNLIDAGDLAPAFRYGRRRGKCVPVQAVDAYLANCQFDPSE